MSKIRKIYLVGFFGMPNLGDEYLCRSMISGLKNLYPECEILTATNNRNISQAFTGGDARWVNGLWPSPRYYLNLHHHIKACLQSELLLLGGGGLLADHYSWVGILRYSAEALLMCAMGKPYAWVGVGVRDIHRKWLRWVARFVCRHASVSSARDELSAARLDKLGNRKDTIRGTDLSGIMAVELSEYARESYALVNLREDPPPSSDKVRDLCWRILEHVDRIVLLAAEKPDVEYYRSLLGLWPAEMTERMTIEMPGSLDDAIASIGQARLVVAERLHVNVLAIQLYRPLVSVNYEGKVARFLERIDAGAELVSLDDLGGITDGLLLEVLERGTGTSPSELHGLRVDALKEVQQVVEVALTARRPADKVQVQALALYVVLLIIGVFVATASVFRRVVVLLRRKTV